MAAPTIETAIWLALKVRVQALVLSPVLPIAWPNEAFSKPSTGGYLRVTWVPNTAQQITLGDSGENRHLGLLQIDVFQPLNQNVAVALEIAGKVAGHFKRGTVMSSNGAYVRIYRPSVVGQPIVGDTDLQVPVTVTWLCDAANPS